MPHTLGYSATLPARTRRRSRSAGRKLSQCLSPPAQDLSDAETTGDGISGELGMLKVVQTIYVFRFKLVCAFSV